MGKAKHALEHYFWAQVKQYHLKDQKVLIACSGGADSVALLRLALATLKSKNIVVANIHHGQTESSELKQFREKSQQWVQDLAQKNNILFVSKSYKGTELENENDMRTWRRHALLNLAEENMCTAIMMAHHQQDVFETRMMRLIRGVTEKNFVAILPWRKPWFRPLLEKTPQELREYLHDKNQDWLEDPTNAENNSFRNWLRNFWLPELEKKQPGATKSFLRNILQITEVSRKKMKTSSGKPEISRKLWETYNNQDKKNALREALLAVNVNSVTNGQLLEVMKRLDNRQKKHSFDMKGFSLCVDSDSIVVKKKSAN